MTSKRPGNIVFTPDAIDHMKRSGLNKSAVLDAYRHPTHENELRRSRRQRVRRVEDKEVGLVYRQNDYGDTVVEHVWMDILKE